MEDRIKARIEKLRKERQDFITQVNVEIGRFSGAIEELELLLKTESLPADQAEV